MAFPQNTLEKDYGLRGILLVACQIAAQPALPLPLWPGKIPRRRAIQTARQSRDKGEVVS